MNSGSCIPVGAEVLAEALNSVDEAIGVYDAEDRLVAFNAHYAECRSAIGGEVALGVCWDDLVKASVLAGTIPEAAGWEEQWLKQRRLLRGDYSIVRCLPDGRSFQVNERRMPYGRGVAVVWTDISELVDAKSRLAVALREAEAANARLSVEIMERQRAEETLRRLNETLHVQVAQRTAELQEKEARLRTIFETSYQYQGLMAIDGTLLEANAASLAGIEATVADVLGKAFWETPWFTGTAGMPEAVRAAIPRVAAGETVRQEIIVNLPTGQRAFDFSMRPVFNKAGEVIAIVPEAIELTERRAAEEQFRQAQKMEAVGQLTGGLAHDFNNLLTGIIGNLELLGIRVAQGRITDLDRYVTAVQGAATRAAALTHRLLAFSRRQMLEPKPTDINRLVAGMEELIRRTVGPEIGVELMAARELWSTLVDQNQLESALLNLCINARDAMPDGGRLKINTGNKWFDEHAARELDLPPGQYVSLWVSDTGTGMTADVMARAFDPFFTTKPVGQGTGLGLSMIYGFVRQSGGQARIYTKQGRGTTVCLYLPRHFGEEDRAELSIEVANIPRAEHGETVLVVDDEPTVRMLITEVLKDLGYAAIDAEDSAAGLKVLQSEGRNVPGIGEGHGCPGLDPSARRPIGVSGLDLCH